MSTTSLAVLVAASIGIATATAGTSTTTNSSKEEKKDSEDAVEKKRFKLRRMLHLFNDNKPVFRDTILFHLLSEYPDDLVGNDGQHQNQMLLRSIIKQLCFEE
mmetsp:Transcript_28817/g.32359  ORF Transcript_28817/g.32359 Transcript_28817/m.32359 type:complete len:103 (+) Transcript_28817:3-311(+)